MFFQKGFSIWTAGSLIFEDTNIIALNKNAKILSHSLPKSERWISAEEQLRRAIQKRVDRLQRDEQSLHLNHRLDYETSGVLLFTRWSQNAHKLSKAIEAKKYVQKKYRAIVSGKIEKEQGTIISGIVTPKDGKKCFSDAEWKFSETHYKIIDQRGIVIWNTRILLSELELEIKTGRKHQIRVHCSSSWFPIIWDRLYWNHQRNELVWREFDLKRHALHAENYSIEANVLWKKYDFKASVPLDMWRIIDYIRHWEQ